MEGANTISLQCGCVKATIKRDGTGLPAKVSLADKLIGATITKKGVGLSTTVSLEESIGAAIRRIGAGLTASVKLVCTHTGDIINKLKNSTQMLNDYYLKN